MGRSHAYVGTDIKRSSIHPHQETPCAVECCGTQQLMKHPNRTKVYRRRCILFKVCPLSRFEVFVCTKKQGTLLSQGHYLLSLCMSLLDFIHQSGFLVVPRVAFYGCHVSFSSFSFVFAKLKSYIKYKEFKVSATFKYCVCRLHSGQ